MNYLTIIISILTFISCSSSSEKNQSIESSDSLEILDTDNVIGLSNTPTLDQNDSEEAISITNLKGTSWIHMPFKEFPDCVDTLNFISKKTGIEYRCEFELSNKIDYLYSNDTLVIYEYGEISEVQDLGQEIKYRWQYVRANNKLNLTGYIEGTEKPIAPTSNDLTYELLQRNN